MRTGEPRSLLGPEGLEMVGTGPPAADWALTPHWPGGPTPQHSCRSGAGQAGVQSWASCISKAAMEGPSTSQFFPARKGGGESLGPGGAALGFQQTKLGSSTGQDPRGFSSGGSHSTFYRSLERGPKSPSGVALGKHGL